MERKLLCLLIVDLFAVASPAFAQSDDFRLAGSVSVGGIHVDDYDTKDASKLNEYRDLESGGLLGFDLKGRGSRYWLDAFGENLGRDDQYVALRGGSYDVFKYRLWTDSLKHNLLFNGLTPYANGTGTVQTATFPRLDTSTWNPIDKGFKRRDDGAMFEFQGVNPWYARVEANQVSSSGTKTGSGAQGTSPGNGFVEFAFPVEYKTRNLSVEGGYATRALQANLSWMLSKFENGEESFSWTNGYWGNGTDRTYLAADNRYSRVAGNVTWRQLPWDAVLAARFTADELTSSVGLATTALGGTAGQILATGPSMGTFDGKVKNSTFSLSANAAPVKGLDGRLYYNWRKRDDDSPPVSFNSSDMPGPWPNRNFSYEKHNYGFDAYYRIDRENRIGGGYDYLETDRDGRFDFDRTKDKRLFLEYKNSMLEDVSARLKYTRLERSSEFLYAGVGTGPTDYFYWYRYNRAFDLTDVKQDQWKLTLDYSPIQNLDLGFEGIIKKNDFDQNTLGRLKDDRREVYVNASYGFPNGIRFTIFGDNEEIKYDSRHRVAGTNYEPSTPPDASNYNWTGAIKDRNWAAGFAIDWPATEKLAVKFSAIYYKTDGNVDLSLQEGVPTSVVPPVPVNAWDDTRRTSFNVKAVYTFSKSLTLTGGYAYEKYEASDAQFDGYRNTIPNSSNQDSYLNGTYAFQPYKASILYGLVTWRF
jgi:hypothetical protein